MAGPAKFYQEGACKSNVGGDRHPEPAVGAAGQPAAAGSKSKDRVQRSYFLDRDIDKALRRMALEEEVNLTEAVNKILRGGLKDYL